jgi:hypothetical protein
MPGKLRTALTNLAALSVSGVAHNYDVDSVPEKVARAQLPCLILLPVVDEGRTKRFGDFKLATPNAAKGLVVYVVAHVLLYAPVGAGRGARSNLPGLVDLVDNYATAIRANPNLSGALFKPTSYVVSMEGVTWAGIRYFGARFWHTFVVQV